MDHYNFRSEVASAPGPISSFGLAPSSYSRDPGRLTRRDLTRLAGLSEVRSVHVDLYFFRYAETNTRKFQAGRWRCSLLHIIDSLYPCPRFAFLLGIRLVSSVRSLLVSHYSYCIIPFQTSRFQTPNERQRRYCALRLYLRLSLLVLLISVMASPRLLAIVDDLAF